MRTAWSLGASCTGAPSTAARSARTSSRSAAFSAMCRASSSATRLIAEKAELRDQVHGLREQIAGVVIPEPPSEQALRILSTAQQTADSYVAEAEEFSRQVTSEARAQYEEQVRLARENAGAIIHAAQEAAAAMTTGGGGRGGNARGAGERNLEELQEQVAYLKAFGQACRVQLRSYLEALLSDVESEWGRADPAGLPADARPPVPRPGNGGGADRSTTFEANTAAAQPPGADADDGVRAGGRSGPAEHTSMEMESPRAT